MPTNTCRTCGKTKPLDAFVADKSRANGRKNKCKECQAQYHAEWRNRTPNAAENQRNAVRQYGQRVGWRKRHYGITDDEYNAMVDEQDGACAICLRPFTDMRACVDHIAGTKFVRGILCDQCNTAIGSLQHDPERIERAAAYVRERIPPH